MNTLLQMVSMLEYQVSSCSASRFSPGVDLNKVTRYLSASNLVVTILRDIFQLGRPVMKKLKNLTFFASKYQSPLAELEPEIFHSSGT